MRDEISLRELVLSIWKGKLTIAIVTIAATLTAIIVNWWVLDPVFEATSTVRVSAIDGNTKTELASLIETAKNDVNLHKLMTDLELDEEKYSIEGLRKRTDIELSKDGNVMIFSVKGKESDQITKIANQMAFSIGTRLKISDLSKEFVDNYKKIDNLEKEIQVLNEAINEIQYQLNNTPEFIISTDRLVDNPLLFTVVEEKMNTTPSDSAILTMESETRNPVYINLEDKLATNSIELKTKQALKAALEEDNNKIQQDIMQLERELDEGFLTSIKSERNLDGNNAVFLSPAIEPTVPIQPRKLMNVAMVFVISLLVSMIIVVFRQYLTESEY